MRTQLNGVQGIYNQSRPQQLHFVILKRKGDIQMADTKNIEELLKENEYLRGEAESFWNSLREERQLHLEIAQKIVKTDRKAIANIILNMHFGKMPSDSCSFCEIFSLREKGRCREDLRCTDCIDSFLQEHYLKKAREKAGIEII